MSRILVIFDFITDSQFPTKDNDDDIVGRQVILKDSTDVDTVIEQLTAIVDKQIEQRQYYINHQDLVNDVMRKSRRRWLNADSHMMLSDYRVIRI